MLGGILGFDVIEGLLFRQYGPLPFLRESEVWAFAFKLVHNDAMLGSFVSSICILGVLGRVLLWAASRGTGRTLHLPHLDTFEKKT